MTPTKLNRAPLTKRISALAFSAAALVTFSTLSPTAHAATPTKEFTALVNALAAHGQTFATADEVQLAQAVTDAIGANPKLKPGNIAGEALKNAGSNAQDGGDEIGAALIAANATDDTLAARDAIKRAGTGKTLNVNLVPAFSTQFFNTDAQAYNLAKLVISTKPGAGAVLGGRASQYPLLGDEDAAVNLVDKAIKTPKLGGAGLGAAAQDITKWVAIDVDGRALGNTANFTLRVANANVNLAPKIGTGGVAGDPTNGGNIVNTLLGSSALPKLRSGVASFMNTVGKVADIEEISRIATAVGNQIATASGTTTAIKFSAANPVVKSLAKAIIAKATTTNNAADINSWDNKEDEIAEVAAYMVGKILNPLTIQGVAGGKPQVTIKNAGSKIFAIVMSAVNVTKGKKIALAAPTLYHDAAIDVAGSVAETLASLREDASTAAIADEFFNTIKAFLLSKAKAIGGAANAQAVADAITAAYEQSPGPSLVDINFEDGTKNSAFPVEGPLTAGALPDRDETDVRPN